MISVKEMALQILKQCTVIGNIVQLPPQTLDAKLYGEVKKQLELIGGYWKGGKTKGFVFENCEEGYIKGLLDEQASGEGRNLKKEHQFFATPRELAERMVLLATKNMVLSDATRFLEPSAGDGALIKAIKEKHVAAVDCFETMEPNRKVLQELAGANLIGTDFLKEAQHKTANILRGRYDIIVANPPFTNNQDIDHIMAMYDCLKLNGRIVTLASVSWTFGSQKKQEAFRNWLKEVDAYQEELPAGTFSDSGTQVRTMLLVIDKLDKRVPVAAVIKLKIGERVRVIGGAYNDRAGVLTKFVPPECAAVELDKKTWERISTHPYIQEKYLVPEVETAENVDQIFDKMEAVTLEEIQQEQKNTNMATAKKSVPAKNAAGAKPAPPAKSNKKSAGVSALISDMPIPGAGSITEIDINNIEGDPNQPRRFFDEKELIDLAQSIGQFGVNSPIMVRPIDGQLHKYMIVFGERRYRASKMAKIKTIPCMIRQLTDDEALELQITENLQRHDPHPMEEAAAFEKMEAKYENLQEIATRVGKSTKYVANRLALNNLLPEFQEIFFAGKCLMKDAVRLARLAADDQKAVFKEEVPKNWKERADWELDDIEYYVNQQENNLDRAPFKTEDAKLYPEAGACGGCRFNSATTPLLFDDKRTARVCGNSVCFGIKKQKSYAQQVEQVLMDPTTVFVTSRGSSDKHKEKAVTDMGGTILIPAEWTQVDVEERPDWDSFVEENTIDEKPDWDNYLQERKAQVGNWEKDAKKFIKNCQEEFKKLEEEWNEELAELKPVFDKEVETWEEEQKELAEARQSGKVKRAFVVSGSNEGTFIDIIPTVQGANKVDAAAPTGAEEEISGIQQREARAKELDHEKVWEKIRSFALSGEGEMLKHGGTMDPVENIALSVAIYDSLGWGEKRYFNSDVLKLEKKQDYGPALAERLGSMTIIERNILFRLFLMQKLFTMGSSHERSYSAFWAKKVTEVYHSDQVEFLVAEQKEIADRRAVKVKQRIDALKKNSKSKK